jgi:hypothetical protein
MEYDYEKDPEGYLDYDEFFSLPGNTTIHERLFPDWPDFYYDENDELQYVVPQSLKRWWGNERNKSNESRQPLLRTLEQTPVFQMW